MEGSKESEKGDEGERAGRTRRWRFAYGSRSYATRRRHCDFAVMREHARANVSILPPRRCDTFRSFSPSVALFLSLFFFRGACRAHLLAHLAPFFPFRSAFLCLFPSRLACIISFLHLRAAFISLCFSCFLLIAHYTFCRT